MSKYLFKVLSVSGLLLLSSNLYAQALKTIRIASPDLTAGTKHAGGGVVDVLYSKKWIEQAFAKQNIQVQWLFFKGAGPAINEALANDQIDFAFLGDLPPILGKAQGLKTQLLVPTSRGGTNYLAVRSDLNVTNLKQLKGLKVGILRGTADELSFVAALKSQGMTTQDVKLVNLDFNAVNAALAAKRIDASWGPARFFALRDKGLVKLPISTRQLNGVGSSQGVFLGRQQFIQSYPKETQQVVNQVVRGLHWLSQDQNHIPQIAIFASQASYPALVYARELHGVNLKFLYSPRFDGYYLKNLQQKIDLTHLQGSIKQKIEIKPWVNDTFVNQAIQSLKLNDFWKETIQYEYLKQ